MSQFIVSYLSNRIKESEKPKKKNIFKKIFDKIRNLITFVIYIR